jgi:hypothetical protein
VQPHYLKSRTVKPITDSRYRAAVAEFLASLSLRHQALLCQVKRDAALCQYIHLLYFRGEAPAAARVLLHGLVYVRRLTLRDPYELKDSRAALKGFERDAPEQQADPAPWEAIVLIADWAVSHLGREGLEAARALVVAYDGYFRPGELLACPVRNILVRRAAAISKMAPVSVTIAPSGDTAGDAPLPRTKAGSYDDTITFGDGPAIASGRGVAAAALIAIRKSRVGTQPICALTLHRWEAIMHEASAALGFTALRLTPHTCRHGGASSDFAGRHRSLDEIQRRGRWLAVASVRRYEKSGRLAKQFSLLPVDVLSGVPMALVRVTLALSR